jgi:hypothetical protein
MDDKDIRDRLRAGEEALERSREVLRRHQDADPFLEKLTTASTAILDRIIERNQPQPRIRRAAAPKVEAKSSIGENLKKLCEECGWTPYKLHKQTGLDKKLVLGHVNKGKGCSLENRKIYAKVFSKALGRPISTDLT